jgi:dihydrodipicolinate synthase/N-acetylneuraminate lyase
MLKRRGKCLKAEDRCALDHFCGDDESFLSGSATCVSVIACVTPWRHLHPINKQQQHHPFPLRICSVTF